MSDPKPLLVGEDNPYGSDPRYALYHYPPNSAGGRLCREVMGLTPREYIRLFDRVNLCAGNWKISEARKTAARLMAEHSVRVFVLLGAKVAKAFGLPYEPFTMRGSMPSDDQLFVQLPHPSGRCRTWNVVGSYGRARRLLSGANVLPTLLEA